MKLENREKHEAELRRRMQRLSREHRRELRDLIASNRPIPDSFWKNVQKETNEELLAILLILWMTSSRQSGMSEDISEGLSGDWIKKRAKAVADSVTNTSRKILVREIPDVEDELPDDLIEDALDSIWTPSRMGMLSKTEVTAAHSGATIAAGKWFGENDRKKFPDGTELVWRLGPCLHCEFCPSLNGTEEEVWGLFLPGGPPAHVSCCCWLDVVPAYLSPGRRPPANLVRMLMDSQGIQPWPAAA